MEDSYLQGNKIPLWERVLDYRMVHWTIRATYIYFIIYIYIYNSSTEIMCVCEWYGIYVTYINMILLEFWYFI